MPTARTLSTPALLVVSIALLAPPAEAPRFGVEPGTVLRKVFEVEWKMELEDMSLTFDGEDFPAGDELSLTQQSHTRVELLDTYGEVEEGRTTLLVREFADLASSSKTDTTSPEGNELDEWDEASELEGLAVRFRWDAESEEYQAEFVEEGGDEELLAELEQDADFAALLPASDVEEGATWKVDVDAVRKAISPGGDLSFVSEDEEHQEEDDLDEQFEDNLSGELTATYRGEREVEGKRLAVIELAGELETEAEQEAGEEGMAGEASMTVELEGELLWDVAGGHFRSFRLAGPCELQFSTKMEEGAHSFLQVMDLAGTLEITGEATPEE